jgi:hypothetical protein
MSMAGPQESGAVFPIFWPELRNEWLLAPLHSPGPEFLKLLGTKIGCPDPGRILRQDASLDCLLTLVGILREQKPDCFDFISCPCWAG